MSLNRSAATLLLAIMLAMAPDTLAQESPPPLPPIEGLDEDQGLPPLPDIEGNEENTAPPLPPIEDGAPPLPPIEEPADGGDEPRAEAPTFEEVFDAWRSRLPVPVYGYLDTRFGPRIGNDPYQSRDFSLGETRLQLESDPALGPIEFTAKVDFLYDYVLQDGDVLLRELNASFSPLPFMDVKVGRQILTWGTGDLIFINDLFPKDYESFFIGRDIEYLKAPSDALKVSLFHDLANLNLVWTPQVDPDNYITGRRLSYYNPMAGRLVGDGMHLRSDEPDSWGSDDELAARLYRNVNGYEIAAYGYHGYWKSPAGIDPARGVFTFPRLNVWGASVRGGVGPGIGNVEVGYYDSRDDTGGDNPLVRNSELRLLVGYKQDLSQYWSDFTVGLQYYLEHMMHHDEYRRTLPAGTPEADENRQILTIRLTKLLLRSDFQLQLFIFWSPTDGDAHLRPYASYKVTDRWRVDGGANIFLGRDDHTMFGQLEHNDNVYFGLRYTF